MAPTPVVALNRAVAVAMADGPGRRPGPRRGAGGERARCRATTSSPPPAPICCAGSDGCRKPRPPTAPRWSSTRPTPSTGTSPGDSPKPSTDSRPGRERVRDRVVARACHPEHRPPRPTAIRGSCDDAPRSAARTSHRRDGSSGGGRADARPMSAAARRRCRRPSHRSRPLPRLPRRTPDPTGWRCVGGVHVARTEG